MRLVIDASTLVGELLRERGKTLIRNPKLEPLLGEGSMLRKPLSVNTFSIHLHHRQQLIGCLGKHPVERHKSHIPYPLL